MALALLIAGGNPMYSRVSPEIRPILVEAGNHVENNLAKTFARCKKIYRRMNSLLSSSGRLLFLSILASSLTATPQAQAAESSPAPPQISISRTTNGQPRFVFPYPAAQSYTVFGASNAAGPYVSPVPGVLAGPTFTVTNRNAMGFYQIAVTPMDSNALFRANVLNRLTYGPSPDDLAHINAVGPEQFIAEQLAADAIVEDLDTTPPIRNDAPPGPPGTNWIRLSASGTATSNNFFLYLSAPGQVYVDDLRLVLGNTPDVGENLLTNGDFEDPELTNAWTAAAIYSQSVITNSPTPNGQSASGTNCLLLIGTGVGSGNAASLQQVFALTNFASTQRFSLSFSYLPVPHPGTNILTARLSGSAAQRTVNLPTTGPLPPTAPYSVNPLFTRLTNSAPPVNFFSSNPVNNSLSEIRAYHLLRAVQSKRQLYEIMVQFFANHFTTEYQKVEDWFDNNIQNLVTNPIVRANLALDLEWREHQKFRQALLNPNCNFHDLLKISIESPAMIIYLDTILSTRVAANENYARELLELHTMGVDNGYVQQDIVELAKMWTGWRVAKKDPASINNPHAPAVANLTNDLGQYVLHFSTNNHNYTVAKRLFTNVVVDPRFGSQFRGGQPYAFTIGTNAFPGTNGMIEGYLVTDYLANLPQTMEFLSVKLCRTFVHDGFEFGVYDYAAASLSPETQLVKECMTAWNTPAGDGRKGNIRAVLRTIFNSALFRGHAAAQQKIKTPLEFAVSAVRALRVQDTDAFGFVSATSDTDGYGLTSPLSRMGGMNLFNRPEPDGFSEDGRIWLSTANLDERWRFAQHLLMATSYGLKNTDYATTRNTSDPAKLVRLKLPAASWNDPAAIVDYFFTLLAGAEGAGNLGMDRQAAIDFLNTADNGTTPSPFNLVSHDGRLRGMIALMMCLPRFQEQ